MSVVRATSSGRRSPAAPDTIQTMTVYQQGQNIFVDAADNHVEDMEVDGNSPLISSLGHATKEAAMKNATPAHPMKTFHPDTTRDLNLNLPRTYPLISIPTTDPIALDIPPELPEEEALRLK